MKKQVNRRKIVQIKKPRIMEFGIKVSGLGDRWFTAPALPVTGLYFSGYGPLDANPDLGDSSITETRGIGGFAMAAAPAITKFVGGTTADAVRYTMEMMNITVSSDYSLTIPSLNFDKIISRSELFVSCVIAGIR